MSRYWEVVVPGTAAQSILKIPGTLVPKPYCGALIFQSGATGAPSISMAFSPHGYDRRLWDIAGERRRVGRKVAQHRGGESAKSAPQRQEPEKADRILRKGRGQHHDRDGADYGAYHAEPALTQRSPKLWLAYDCCGGTGPKRIVELEPECDVKRKADGSPQPEAKQQG